MTAHRKRPEGRADGERVAFHEPDVDEPSARERVLGAASPRCHQRRQPQTALPSRQVVHADTTFLWEFYCRSAIIS